MNLKEKIKEHIESVRNQTDLEVQKNLFIVQVDDDPASNLYVKSKLEEAKKWNILCHLMKFDSNVDSQRRIGNNITYESFLRNDALIIQMPLPKSFNNQFLIDSIHPIANVDGFWQSGKEEFEYYYPCAPLGILSFLEDYVDLESKTVAVIGRGDTVGKPLVKMLLKRNCTVIECNSYTPAKVRKQMLKSADVVISAVGKPNLFCVDDLKPGCIVMDAGISRVDGKQIGDFSHEGDLSKVDYTPWTNGIGKLTVAALMMNVRKRV